MITIAGTARSALLWTLVGAGTVSAAGIVINIATDLKTSILAWLAVIVATMTVGVLAWASQYATSGGPAHQAIVAAGITGLALAVILGILALALASGTEQDAAEAAGQRHRSQDPTQPTLSDTTAPPTTTVIEPQSRTAAPTRVIQSVPSYKLVSSSDFCPTSDKIDLDTAHSGYGGQPQIGDIVQECRVEGGLAELILEQGEIHTPKNSQLLYLPNTSAPTDQATCRDALRQIERLRSRISLNELHAGSNMCVKTDQGNVAQLTIINLSRGVEAEMTLRFTTWG